MEDLEKQKTELSIQIIKEEMTKPIISAEEIEAYFNRLRKLNFKKIEHRRRLINTFINKIVLYDDGRIYFGCNYKDCSKEMTFAELEEANVFSSDISALGAPKLRTSHLWCPFNFISKAALTLVKTAFSIAVRFYLLIHPIFIHKYNILSEYTSAAGV